VAQPQQVKKKVEQKTPEIELLKALLKNIEENVSARSEGKCPAECNSSIVENVLDLRDHNQSRSTITKSTLHSLINP
jgi:hypothetical protein